jgi:hypothetical protein
VIFVGSRVHVIISLSRRGVEGGVLGAGVAQIFNLLYRRLAVGRLSQTTGALATAESWRIENPQYGRLKICATEWRNRVNRKS